MTAWRGTSVAVPHGYALDLRFLYTLRLVLGKAVSSGALCTLLSHSRSELSCLFKSEVCEAYGLNSLGVSAHS